MERDLPCMDSPIFCIYTCFSDYFINIDIYQRTTRVLRAITWEKKSSTLQQPGNRFRMKKKMSVV